MPWKVPRMLSPVPLCAVAVGVHHRGSAVFLRDLGEGRGLLQDVCRRVVEK